MDNTLAMTLQPQSLEPTAEDVAMLTKQYQKALDGLYEAYRFGMMLRAVKERLDAADGAGACAAPTPPAEAQGASPRPAPTGAGFVDAGIDDTDTLGNGGFSSESARGPAREIVVGKNGNLLTGSGWNRGTGLKAWLARYCPEINYSTAKRFLAVAEKTVAALALADEAEASEAAAVGSASPASPESWGEAPCASAGEGARSPFPPEAAQVPAEAGTPFAIPTFPEATVRAFLEGKSQRAVLRAGGARAGAGRPRKDWAAALGTSPEAAFKRLEEALAPLNELIVVKGTHRLLAAADLETVRAAVALLAARLAEAE